ncbi:MAG: ABC transporter ATP-binding protein [Alphaproteobacteria bacterium]|nr:ABC transporter ATP-binding protein [Alphaproteobacteria bacterium]
MPLLEILDVTKRFGGLAAIEDLNFAVERGEIRGLIGPNGAGKTTLFNVISGVYRPTHGRVVFKDQEISNLKPHRVVRLGLARTFQSVTLFKNFSVLKNVLAGLHLNSNYNYWGALFNTPNTRKNERANTEKAWEILEFVGLSEHADDLAANLPHGYQRALGIGIALASQPELLMLDEPCAGMNTEETDEMVNLIKRIRDNGTTVLLIEHDMKVVMGICHNITVINFGTRIAEGTPKEILENELVHEAYLGSDIHAA